MRKSVKIILIVLIITNFLMSIFMCLYSMTHSDFDGFIIGISHSSIGFYFWAEYYRTLIDNARYINYR